MHALFVYVRLQNSLYFCVFKYAMRVRLASFTRVRHIRHALPISLLMLRKKNDCFAVYVYVDHQSNETSSRDQYNITSFGYCLLPI